MNDVRSNSHATTVVIGDRGILIRGVSGSGKTSLALALIAAAQSAGRYAALLADDQIVLSAAEGRLVGHAPPTIEGLVEVRGATPQRLRCETSGLIDLVVTLVEPAAAPRFSETLVTEIAGLLVPNLVLEHRNIAAAMPAIACRLGLPPFL